MNPVTFYSYELAESNETYGNEHRCTTLTIIKWRIADMMEIEETRSIFDVTRQTVIIDDFTYFEEGTDTQENLKALFETNYQTG